MKKWIRICAAALAVGLVCFIGGAAAGGRLYSSTNGHTLFPFGWKWLHPIDIDLPDIDLHHEDDDARGTGRHGIRSSVWEPAPLEPDNALPAATPDLPAMETDLPRVTTLKELEIEVGAGNYTIAIGDDYGLDYDGGDWIDSRIDNGVWKIRSDSGWFNFGLGSARNCTITVPEGCALEKLELSIGAGNLMVDAPISAEKVELDVGAGNLTVSALDFTDKLEAEVGAGNLSLTLLGKQEDYRINAEVAMGTITFNGSDLTSGLAGKASRGDGARKVSIEVGMGRASIYTAQ